MTENADGTMTRGVGVVVMVVGLLLAAAVSFAKILQRHRKLRGASAAAKADDYLTARNSYAWLPLGFSFYAGGMGGWLLFAPAETGMIAGWLGVVAYAISNASPFWLMIWLGPKVKAALGPNTGFTVADFARVRYGKPAHLLVSLTSIFFMFLFLTAELTSIGEAFQMLVPGSSMIQTVAPVAAVTLLYTVLGGAPSAISTDLIVGTCLALLAAVSVIAVSARVGPNITREGLNEASRFTASGVNAVATLWVSTTMNQFLDHSMWQRVFAARTTADIRRSLFLGGACAIPTVFLFGAIGVIAAAANFSGAVDIPEGLEFSALFVLLQKLQGKVWPVVVGFLAMCMSTSTIDSLQAGILGMMASHLSFTDNDAAGEQQSALPETEGETAARRRKWAIARKRVLARKIYLARKRGRGRGLGREGALFALPQAGVRCDKRGGGGFELRGVLGADAAAAVEHRELHSGAVAGAGVPRGDDADGGFRGLWGRGADDFDFRLVLGADLRGGLPLVRLPAGELPSLDRNHFPGRAAGDDCDHFGCDSVHGDGRQQGAGATARAKGASVIIKI